MSSNAICCVMTSDRSIDLVYSTLNAFLKNKPDLNLDYTFDPHSPDRVFSSEVEMVSCFADDVTLSQLFFWQDEADFIDMVGVFFMEDGHVVYSITTMADSSSEDTILERLKAHLTSDIAFISYNQYPPFSTSAEFISMASEAKNLSEQVAASDR